MGTHSIEPFQAIRSYRSITGMPDIGERAAARSSEGTVAFTLVDDTPVFGVNSNALAYTANDQASAEEMRDRLVGLYPETMRSDNLGWKPNDALFHAEVNALLRASSVSNGTLSGRTLTIRIDRELCRSCETVLPKIGVELGNPTVRFIDGRSELWIILDGIWIAGGRR